MAQGCRRLFFTISLWIQGATMPHGFNTQYAAQNRDERVKRI
jgi:hypothetical protein